jgi:hypothetical protein
MTFRLKSSLQRFYSRNHELTDRYTVNVSLGICFLGHNIFLSLLHCVCNVQHFILSYVFTFWVPCCDVRYDFRIKRCSLHLYLQLFVGELMSYLRYSCLFSYSAAQHILTMSSMGCLIRVRNCVPFVGAWVHPSFLVGSVLLIFLVFCVVFFV